MKEFTERNTFVPYDQPLYSRFLLKGSEHTHKSELIYQEGCLYQTKDFQGKPVMVLPCDQSPMLCSPFPSGVHYVVDGFDCRIPDIGARWLQILREGLTWELHIGTRAYEQGTFDMLPFRPLKIPREIPPLVTFFVKWAYTGPPIRVGDVKILFLLTGTLYRPIQ